MKNINFQEAVKLISSIILCQLAGLIGSLFTAPSIPVWYASLEKPFFTPPSSVFAPVWILLYFLMGISLYLVIRKGFSDKGAKTAIIVFIIQLVLNALWSILFFGMKNPAVGFLDIILLWLAILVTIIFFFKISKISAMLLIPYILWVSFAAVLNFSLWRLNV